MDTSIDGGSLITLDGGDATRVFVVNSGATLTVANLIISDGLTFGSGANGGTLTVTDSTFAGNQGFGGGAIYTDGGTLTATNCTFSGNFTDGPDNFGGAIAGGTLTVTNCTFFGNAAYSGNGGAIYSGTATLVNTIVAKSGGNRFGTITDGGHNLDSDGTCGVGPATDPMLDPAGLANNGGPTQTIALQAGSPAINAGNESICSAQPVNYLDQRGYVRPGTGSVNCSVGAYEYHSPGAPGCCQCPASCAAPNNGSCGDCMPIFDTTCQEEWESVERVLAQGPGKFSDRLGGERSRFLPPPFSYRGRRGGTRSVAVIASGARR